MPEKAPELYTLLNLSFLNTHENSLGLDQIHVCLHSRCRYWAVAAASCDWKCISHLGRANTGAAT